MGAISVVIWRKKTIATVWLRQDGFLKARQLVQPGDTAYEIDSVKLRSLLRNQSFPLDLWLMTY